jgi:hypothetical protein
MIAAPQQREKSERSEETLACWLLRARKTQTKRAKSPRVISRAAEARAFLARA